MKQISAILLAIMVTIVTFGQNIPQKNRKIIGKRLNTQQNSAKSNSSTIADSYLRKSEFFKKHNINDSAAFYLKARAELDTTNIDWQTASGLFLADYIANYDEALYYFNRALRHALKNENNLKVATTYNNIGLIYFHQNNLAKALEFYNRALKHTKKTANNNQLLLLISNLYDNIGQIYNMKGEYTKALEFYNKALEIANPMSEENHLNLSNIFNYECPQISN